MKKYSRIIVFIMSLSLILAYFLPLWEIDLEAPQYPEGLGMKICINKLSGDIAIINGLNHYIGMKFIVEDYIPELKFMPYILAALIALFLTVAATGKKMLLQIAVVLFVIVGVVGAVDFYMWEYDYGHDLDPHAAIKVPGMNYQPPLWGSKQLLNFTAHSYPDTGGWIILLGGISMILVGIYETFFNIKKKSIKDIIQLKWAALILILVPFLGGCKYGPKPIKYGVDVCHHCKMTIMDNRFGSEVITEKGKVYTFDSVECLYSYAANNNNPKDSLLTIDFSRPGTWIDARRSMYFICRDLPSPMGKNITAFGSEEQMKKVKESNRGITMRWEELPTALGIIK